ncbi:hypothetical protein [Flavobacterium sp.]|uniref:hypothetical protein n=1 Tax=Flavobacterium sp. TaxID=239 RepID=UPI002EDA4C21
MNKIYKVHSLYILSILISIIIGLITIKWGEFENLVNLISFALTITSLVLAILAIMYAVYSNNSFISNITKLDVSSEKIKNSATALDNLSTTLVEKIEQIPSILNSIEQKTDATQILISKLNLPNTITSDNNFNPNEIDLENFIYQNSTSGQTLLYILLLSLQTKKQFNLKEICDKHSLGFDYYNGFFVAVQTLKIVKTEIEYKDGDFHYLISEMNSYLEKNIMELIGNVTNEDVDKYFKINIQYIDAFFK